jgi:hypothetical protein
LLKNHLRIFVDLKNITGSNYEEVYGYSTQKFNATAGIALKL